MRVLLIVPPHRYKDPHRTLLSLSDFPSGYAYLASSLKTAGHEVYGLNLNNIILPYQSNLDMVTDQITRKIAEVQPGLIGMGGLAIDYKFLKEGMQIVRKVASNIPVVIGGGIVTHDAEFIFDLLKPDFAIKGEAEGQLIHLISAIQNGKAHIHNSMPLLPIDSLPFPDYEPFGIRDMLDNYWYATRMLYRYTRPYPRTMVITTARGCPFSCTFCIHGHDSGRKYRARSIENIMAEIKAMYERYEFNVLIIQDELFAVNKPRLREFCEAVLIGKEKYGWDFDWLFQSHASAKFDLDTLKLAKRAGCYFFSYGLESASPTVLKSMNKRTKPEQVIEAIKLAEQAEIGFGGNLIFGDPAETPETIAESMCFFFRHLLDNVVPLFNVQPYPGSKIFEDMKEKVQLNKLDYYEHINEGVWNMTKMSNETLNSFIQWLNFFENTQMWVKETDAIWYEEEIDKDTVLTALKRSIFKVHALCPHCGQAVFYRELAEKIPFQLLTCCTECHKKIKVNMKDVK